MSEPEQEPLGPAERRVAELVGRLRGDAAGGDGPPTATLIRRVRLERGVRHAAEVVGLLASALVEGAGLLLGLRSRGRRS